MEPLLGRALLHPLRIARRLRLRHASTAKIKDVLASSEAIGRQLRATGWVRSVRSQKSYSFLELNDGTSATNLQVIWKNSEIALADDQKALLSTGASVTIEGTLVASPKPNQPVELQAKSVTVVGGANAESYPIQKKAHTPEFLRDMVHLRPRTTATAAVLRVRDTLQHALHAVLRADGCLSVNTPVLTANDCEGAGELFSVLPAADLKAYQEKARLAGQPQNDATSVSAIESNHSNSAPGKAENQPSSGISSSERRASPCDRFFGKQVYLTVSGQLHLEAFACSMGRVYTFGPTFRAENSNTQRHACEFWMLEPELAPGSMGDAMDLAERCVKGSLTALLAERPDDVRWLNDKVDSGLLQRITTTADASRPFARMSYTEAIRVLQSSGKAFKLPVKWEDGLASEHERFLAEEHVKGPLFVTDYPAAIKPFYMKANSDSDATASSPSAAGGGAPGPTVQAFDLLMPTLGELVGGSAREDRHDVLAQRMASLGLLSPRRLAALASGTPSSAPPADCESGSLDWYLDLRRWGSLPHAGFGLGFERLVMFATGVSNIRDVLPVPRVPDSCRM